MTDSAFTNVSNVTVPVAPALLPAASVAVADTVWTTSPAGNSPAAQVADHVPPAVAVTVLE